MTSTGMEPEVQGAAESDACSGLHFDHPYDYYYQKGMEYRPYPAKLTQYPTLMHFRKLTLKAWVDTNAIPSNEYASATADAQWEGDRLMDPIVDYFIREGGRQARATFEKALEEGIDSIENPSQELVDLFGQLDTYPDWFSREQWERGRRRWIACSPVAKFGAFNSNSVMTMFEVTASSATGQTGRLASDPVQRNFETAKWFVDSTAVDLPNRFSEAFKTTVRIRLMHALARRSLKKRWGEKVYSEMGSPIPATGAGLGAGTFGLTAVLIDHAYGWKATEADLDDVAVYWSYISYLMGAPEQVLFPKGRHLIAGLDSMFFHPGEFSPWSREMAGHLAHTGLVMGRDGNDFKSALARKLVNPLMLGIMQAIYGPFVVHHFIRDIPGANMPTASTMRLVKAIIASQTLGARTIAKMRKKRGSEVPTHDPIYTMIYQYTKRVHAEEKDRSKARPLTYAAHDLGTGLLGVDRYPANH